MKRKATFCFVYQSLSFAFSFEDLDQVCEHGIVRFLCERVSIIVEPFKKNDIFIVVFNFCIRCVVVIHIFVITLNEKKLRRTVFCMQLFNSLHQEE